MNVQTIPTLGFARGAVVRTKGGGPNMLVVRGMGARTVVVVVEGDADGQISLRDIQTETLEQALATATPESR